MTISITDHALLRFLERAGSLDVQGVRAALRSSLERAIGATARIGVTRYTIHADGLVYVVRDGAVVTVLVDTRGDVPVTVRAGEAG